MNGNVKYSMNEGRCDGFIQKPYKVRELSQKIREVLDVNVQQFPLTPLPIIFYHIWDVMLKLSQHIVII